MTEGYKIILDLAGGFGGILFACVIALFCEMRSEVKSMARYIENLEKYIDVIGRETPADPVKIRRLVFETDVDGFKVVKELPK